MLPIMPTFRGGVLILIAIVAFFVAMVNPGLATAMVASALIALIIASLILSFFTLFGLELSREICKDGIKDEKIYLPLTLKNITGRRRQACLIRESLTLSREPWSEFSVHALLPLEARTLERYVLASRRGKFHFNKVQLIGGDPAGLFQRIKTFHLPVDISVFPAIEKITFLQLQTKNKIRSTISGQPLGISGQGQDIFGLREYRQRDPVRLIHWKASARQQKLVVKEFEDQGLNRISVLLDNDQRYFGKDMYDNNFEYLIKTAASIINYLSGMYCETSFITADDKTDSIMCETGSAYSLAGTTNEILSELQPGKVNIETLLEASLDIVPDDSILYCLSMSADERLYQYFDVLTAKGIEVRWLFAPPECFPKIIPGINLSKPDTSLFGYGMHNPTPVIAERDLKIEGLLAV